MEGGGEGGGGGADCESYSKSIFNLHLSVERQMGFRDRKGRTMVPSQTQTGDVAG